MSSRQPSEAISSQRERDLSAQLQESALEKCTLLKQLLDAKSELLEASRQREQHLSDQLNEKISELEAAYIQKESLTAHLDQHITHPALLEKNVGDPHTELLKKETALQASRQQERQLTLELQTVKTDFASYKNREKYRVDKLEQAGEDLRRSKEEIKLAGDKIADIEKELQKAKADVEAAAVRERGLKSKLVKSERLLKINCPTFGRQTPSIAFGAPSPITGPRPTTPSSHPIVRIEQERPSIFFGSSNPSGQPQQRFSFLSPSTTPSASTQSAWKPTPPDGSVPPQQGQITSFGGS